MTILKLTFLTIAIWFTFVNIVKVFKNQTVQASALLIMAVSIVGFLYLQFDFLK